MRRGIVLGFARSSRHLGHGAGFGNGQVAAGRCRRARCIWSDDRGGFGRGLVVFGARAIDSATSICESGSRYARIVSLRRRGVLIGCKIRIDCAGLVEFFKLLVKVVVKAVAFYQCRVRLLQLLAIEADKDGSDIVDELIDPAQM